MNLEAILFDMDGVLVDVSNSYRVAIQKTVRYFTHEKIDVGEITTLKNAGGYNNDWRLTEAILESRGKHVDFSVIVDMFQTFYLGKDWNGLIRNETWQLNGGALDELSREYKLGIVTGRPRKEAEYVLRRFGVEDYFQVVIALEDIPPEKEKPHPYGILKAMKVLNVSRAVYIGDTVDDMRAAVSARLVPIGIIHQHNGKGLQESVLRQHGAQTVVSDINGIVEVLNEKVYIQEKDERNRYHR